MNCKSPIHALGRKEMQAFPSPDQRYQPQVQLVCDVGMQGLDCCAVKIMLVQVPILVMYLQRSVSYYSIFRLGKSMLAQQECAFLAASAERSIKLLQQIFKRRSCCLSLSTHCVHLCQCTLMPCCMHVQPQPFFHREVATHASGIMDTQGSDINNLLCAVQCENVEGTCVPAMGYASVLWVKAHKPRFLQYIPTM